ncbi:hypothetical protein GN958_ATG11835 [Phytophthora infestans]|uniref:Secreted RxLR effector peptide protein n=1 Tax=Phytophthora infestans TaxID=4787 RepID=A0A8S9UK91_PHYIN|nr:hypothetical protein GN958_ATG11835 [Phytophthora infestans]
MISGEIGKLAGLIKTGAVKIGENLNLGYWLPISQSTEDILKLFRLENGLDRALSSPDVKRMETYLRSVNKYKRKNKMSVLGVFSAYYGDDAVATVLVSAQRTKKSESKFQTILQLRNAQLSGWLKDDESVDDVFRLLKLHTDGYSALGSPKLEALDYYMKMFNREKSGQETLLQVLTNGFDGEHNLAKLLIRAKKDPRTSELANAMENALLNKWLSSKSRPVDVLKMLKLNEYMDEALLDPTYHTFYLDVQRKKSPYQNVIDRDIYQELWGR